MKYDPMKILLLPLLLLVGFIASAQDTLWVKQKEGRPYLVHRVRSGETLFLLSKKYSVPPAVLADLNEVSYQDGLEAGSKFRIPIDQYNFIRIESVVKSRPIFYKAGEEDDLHSISRMFNIPQSALQRWNHKDNPDVEAGMILQVGWVAYDKEQIPFATADTAKAAATRTVTSVSAASKPEANVKPAVSPKLLDRKAPDKDTAIAEESAFELLYDQQVQGVALNEESGAATFYPLRTKVAPDVYYALHNTAARGSILKIMNPASGKIIYAKVIGTIPNLKEYHNTIVGLSNNAIAALGATDRRMFCRLSYR